MKESVKNLVTDVSHYDYSTLKYLQANNIPNYQDMTLTRVTSYIYNGEEVRAKNGEVIFLISGLPVTGKFEGVEPFIKRLTACVKEGLIRDVYIYFSTYMTKALFSLHDYAYIVYDGRYCYIKSGIDNKYIKMLNEGKLGFFAIAYPEKWDRLKSKCAIIRTTLDTSTNKTIDFDISTFTGDTSPNPSILIKENFFLYPKFENDGLFHYANVENIRETIERKSLYGYEITVPNDVISIDVEIVQFIPSEESKYYTVFNDIISKADKMDFAEFDNSMNTEYSMEDKFLTLQTLTVDRLASKYESGIKQGLLNTYLYDTAVLKKLYLGDIPDVDSITISAEELKKRADERNRATIPMYFYGEGKRSCAIIFKNGLLYEWYYTIEYDIKTISFSLDGAEKGDMFEILFFHNLSYIPEEEVTIKEKMYGGEDYFEYYTNNPKDNPYDIENNMTDSYWQRCKVNFSDYDSSTGLYTLDQTSSSVSIGDKVVRSYKYNFKYVSLEVEEASTNYIHLPHIFRFCQNAARYMVFFNGKLLMNDEYIIVSPTTGKPYNEVAIFTRFELQVHDRIDIFYVPIEFRHATVDELSGDGDIVYKKLDIGYLSRDLSLVFINGYKIRHDELKDISNVRMRVLTNRGGNEDIHLLFHSLEKFDILESIDTEFANIYTDEAYNESTGVFNPDESYKVKDSDKGEDIKVLRGIGSITEDLGSEIKIYNDDKMAEFPPTLSFDNDVVNIISPSETTVSRALESFVKYNKNMLSSVDTSRTFETAYALKDKYTIDNMVNTPRNINMDSNLRIVINNDNYILSGEINNAGHLCAVIRSYDYKDIISEVILEENMPTTYNLIVKFQKSDDQILYHCAYKINDQLYMKDIIVSLNLTMRAIAVNNVTCRNAYSRYSRAVQIAYWDEVFYTAYLSGNDGLTIYGNAKYYDVLPTLGDIKEIMYMNIINEQIHILVSYANYISLIFVDLASRAVVKNISIKKERDDMGYTVDAEIVDDKYIFFLCNYTARLYDFDGNKICQCDIPNSTESEYSFMKFITADIAVAIRNSKIILFELSQDRTAITPYVNDRISDDEAVNVPINDIISGYGDIILLNTYGDFAFMYYYTGDNPIQYRFTLPNANISIYKQYMLSTYALRNIISDTYSYIKKK